MEKIKSFFKNEPVLWISFLLAAVSAFFVKPNSEYLNYIDFRTLSLLFCLMSVMAGLNSIGVFKNLAERFLKRVKTVRGIGLVMCLLCFFSSMIITNDVSLITFVPFTIIILKMTRKTDKMIFIVTMETVAANLGSMLTPKREGKSRKISPRFFRSKYNLSCRKSCSLAYFVVKILK